jgi:signal transduction histidine kinase
MRIFNNFCILLVCVLCYNRAWGQGCNTERLNQKLKELTRFNRDADFYGGTIAGKLAIEEAQKCKDDIALFKSYATTAYCYMQINVVDTAWNMYQLAGEIAKRIKRPRFDASLSNDIGVFFKYAKLDYTKGIKYFEKSIKIYDQIKDSSAQSLFPRYNILDCFFETKNLAKFEEYSNFINQSIYSESELDSMARLTLLAQLEYMRKNYKQSLLYLDKINKKQTQHSFHSEKHQMLYAQNHYALGNFAQAFNLMELIIEDLKKIKQDEKNKATNYQQLIIRNKLFESKYEKESQNNKFFAILVVGLFIFLIFLLYFYANSYKKSKEIRFKNSLLSKRNKEITGVHKELETAISEKNKLISTINHELRTPIHGIMGLIDYAKEDVNTNFQSQIFNDIQLQALHLKDLIEDSLFLNNSRLAPQYYPVEIENLIKTQINLLSYLQKNCHIEINIQKNLEVINTDSQLLSVLMRKLLSNAFKFTTDGLIKINVSHTETNEINLEIKDTGIGIPEDKLKAIFDPFFQVNRTQKGLEGIGLGLTIVRSIVNFFNGSIRLTSTLNQGSCFNILLPVVPFTSSKVEPGIKKFLIVEDNQINQFVLQKIIQKAGHQATIAENGQVAVEIAKKHKFDFILMDINMPIMDGIEATKQIRFFDNLTPIIGVTALSDYSVQKQSFNAGMNKFITKPFDINMFKNILNIQ